jgi:hypothetical protein
MRTWNKRAVQGALIRLDQSGMIKRFRVRKKKSEDSWVICVQIQREPRAEDLENLGFRRQAAIVDTADELLQDDGDGDTLMRDLEIDMLDDGDENVTNNNLNEDIRIPPQWTPDRLLANIIFNFTELGQVLGWDSVVLRDRVVGPFWRRPMESYLTRLTDDWERMQPSHLRHLAIIRDTRNTEEKKFIHYVYRTHGYFQQAVTAGEAIWEGVRRPAAKSEGKSNQLKKDLNRDSVLDSWGFRSLNQKDFVRFDGTATLTDVRSAIVNPRKYGPRWDNALAEEIGYQKFEIPVPKIKTPRRSKKAPTGSGHHADRLDDDDDADEQSVPARASGKRKVDKIKKKGSGLTLTPEQRSSLGLKPTGRLSKNVANQILSHRRETGDPESLPDTITEEPVVIHGKAPLMTKEERLAENLPARGRLGLEKENEIREKRGMPKLVEKPRKKRASKEAAILTKQQRIALGFKGHGRLHQHFVDALRQEQEDDVPLEKSPAVEAYREFLKAETAKGAARKVNTGTSGLNTPAEEHDPSPISEAEQEARPDASNLDVETRSPPLSPVSTIGKRAASGNDVSLPVSKRARTATGPTQKSTASSLSQPSELAFDCTTPIESLGATVQEPPSSSNTVSENGPRHRPQENQHDQRATPVQQSPARSAMPISSGKKHNSCDENLARTVPGVYVYLSAKRKVARGRPRNACIAVFRTSLLSSLPWFAAESNSSVNSSQVVALGAVTKSLERTGKPMESGTLPETLPTPESPQVSQALQSEGASEGASEFSQVADSTSEALPKFPRPHVEESGSQAEPGRQELQNSVASGSDMHPSHTVLSPQRPESGSDVHDIYAVPAIQQAPTLVAEVASTAQEPRLRAASILNTINASAQVTQSSYQSPYAPSVRSSYTAPTLQAVTANATTYPTMRLETPALETSSTMSTPTPIPMPMPQGVVGVIAEVEQANTATQKKASARSAGPGITGSALKFRREIILDIIERCGGVFPLHGEIWRPFNAMWDRRHGHTSIPKPGSSTVTDTLKNMISSPAFNLKRMAFLVKARNATGAKERVMVTKSDMAPNDKRVMQLAYNMANNALDKSHQYYPEEIRDVFEYETMYVPVPAAPKDETLFLDQIYPELLESSIKENKDRRRREKAAQKQREKQAAKAQNEQVEKAIPKRQGQAQQTEGAPRTKRTRLASLNDKDKRYRRAPAQVPTLEDLEESRGDEMREPSPARSDSPEDIPLVGLRPWLASEIVDCGADDEDASPVDIEEEDDDMLSTVDMPTLHFDTISFTHPVVCFHSTTGTFSTSFGLITPPGETLSHVVTPTARKSTTSKAKKRVRIDDSLTERSSKKSRRSAASPSERLDDEFVYSSVEDSDATSSEDEEEEVRPKRKQKRKSRANPQRLLGKNLPTPTLLERLTGLTGDPNDPIYTDPALRQRSVNVRPWAERKKKQIIRIRKEREYAETLDHADKFKKLCLTLVLASSMSGEDGGMNWSIVEKVYARDHFFNALKVKKLWAWMQTHMAKQLEELTNILQTNLLAAYDSGRLPAIDDPAIYDWAGLVRWTMRTCEYPDMPLPVYREALEHFVIDESGYANLDRVNWYGKKIADTVRTQQQLQLSFVAPLHRPHAQGSPVEDMKLKARSWIRANTATPQAIYHANKAHEKLTLLGEDILTRVVGDFVQQEHLKMRKLKRQLPGRNYTFTKKFAKTYKRPFELEDFMVAATVKKELDTVFANEDSEKRFYSISRCEEDGSIMALMSLVGDGKVKLMPKLPPVDNEFGAPLPRLSKWGFCEGDYIHRAIDRNRLFWEIHAVPTSDYQFGNPLQPLPAPAADWPSLPDPPLPGKHDDGALLPIWSSIDGQSVTWPWWYRILNLTLQPLYLQPGVTAIDVHAHCPEHTTEVFEVQLVLDWLESIGAASKTVGGGYQVTSNFWAAFGDRLLHTEEDWFGEHVKRNTKMTTKQQWRDKYNLRYHTMHARDTQRVVAEGGEGAQVNSQTRGANEGVSQRIAQNSKAQYRILQQAMLEPQPKAQSSPMTDTQIHDTAEVPVKEMNDTRIQIEHSPAPAPIAQAQPGHTSHTPEGTNMPSVDVEMVEAGADANFDADAEGEEDVDAEGEDVDAEGEDDDAEGEVDDAVY